MGTSCSRKIKMIDTTRHVIIKSPHPSPLSAHRGFGSRPFSQANAALERLGKRRLIGNFLKQCSVTVYAVIV